MGSPAFEALPENVKRNFRTIMNMQKKKTWVNKIFAVTKDGDLEVWSAKDMTELKGKLRKEYVDECHDRQYGASAEERREFAKYFNTEVWGVTWKAKVITELKH